MKSRYTQLHIKQRHAFTHNTVISSSMPPKNVAWVQDGENALPSDAGNAEYSDAFEGMNSSVAVWQSVRLVAEWLQVSLVGLKLDGRQVPRAEIAASKTCQQDNIGTPNLCLEADL